MTATLGGGYLPGKKARVAKGWSPEQPANHRAIHLERRGFPMATDTVNQASLTGERGAQAYQATAAELHHARELLDTLATEIQDLYAFAPDASIRGNMHADALLCGIGHVIENAARGGASYAAGIEEALCLLTELRDGLPKPAGKNAAMWHRANGLVSGICAALSEAGQEAEEGAPEREAAKPPGAVGIAASAAVSQAAEAFGNESAGALWQMAMDEACNTNVHDAEAGLTNVIALLDALKPHLMGAPDHSSATVQGGAALADGMKERAALACKAACEAHSLAELVGKAIDDDESNDGARDAMHSMLLRIQRLSCCVLSTLDDGATLDDIRQQMSAA